MDDGSGLVIKFEPINHGNIIEYRIYRGIRPDSLFYLGKLEVDPKIGISGNEVIFFDKDYRTLVDIDSPRRLKREKGQSIGSPIFKSLPRDYSVIGHMFKEFNTLVIIDKNRFFKTTKKYNKESDEEKKIYGSLRIEHTDGILANVIPGKRYYYSVIAVDQRNVYHPFAGPVTGIAVDNKPDKPEKFYAVLIEDLNQINFEYDPPFIANDIFQYSVYMIKKTDLDDYKEYVKYMNDIDDLMIKFPAQEMQERLSEIMPSEAVNPGELIYSTHLTFGSVKYEEGYFINTNIEFNTNCIDDYLFYLSYDDYAGFQSLSDPISLRIVDSSALPTLPKFIVRDKPADKGDTNEILIGKPLAAITQINYRGRGRNRNKLSVAYSYSPLPHYKVKSISFHFVEKNDKHIKTITRYYFDNVFNIELPTNIKSDDGFKVYISFNAPNTSIHKEKLYWQEVNYDNELMQLRPGHTYSGNEHLLKYRYLVMSQAKSAVNFNVVAKISPLINSVDDTVSEKYIFKQLSGHDAKKKRILFDTNVDLGFDTDFGTDISTNLFYKEYVESIKHDLNRYKARLIDDPDDEEALFYTDHLQTTLNIQTEHPKLSSINKIMNQRKRISKIIKIRDIQNLSFRYSLVKTDNEGLFVESTIYQNKDNNEYFMPYSNWFNMKNMPMLAFTLVFTFFVFYYFLVSRKGKELYLRPIAGLEEIDNAIGRATEMGRPILYVPGLGYIEDIATLAALSILGYITKRAAVYDTRIIVPCHDYIVLPIAQQIVKESFATSGRPDSYNPNDVFFVSDSQFAYVAGVNGIMIRDKTATNFYMGMFFAEALIMTETGNSTGAIQIAGCDELTQIPFFITTCDYTLIGEELYAASAYMTKDPIMLGTLKSQDYTKMLIIIFIVLGTILSTINITGLINWFPAE